MNTPTMSACAAKDWEDLCVQCECECDGAVETGEED